MTFIRTKMVNGSGPYYYEVRSEREGSKVRQVHVQYLGSSPPVMGKQGWESTDPVVIERVVPKEPTHETLQYEGVTLTRQEDFSNGTKFYTQESVDAESVSQIRDSFERLPPRMQNGTPSIQVFSEKGKGFKVGEKDFETWGHWDRRSGAVRVWTGGTKTDTPGRADSLVAHEVTHTAFDRYAKRYEDLDEASRPKSDEVEKDFKAKRQEIDERYAPKLKAKEDRLDAVSKDLKERRFEFLDDSGQNREKGERLTSALEKAKKTRAKAQGDYTRVSKQRDREKAAYGFDKTDEEYYRRKRSNLDAAIDKDGPHMRAWVDFFAASKKEGGLTNYSNSYRGEPENIGGKFHNENLAEATSIWYTVPHRVYTAQPGRDPDTGAALPEGSSTPGVGYWTPSDRVEYSYPETHRAYFRLMETEAEGHSVPLKYRPRGYDEREIARR
jgi:hypothetical protein